jgi:polysaccharide biosynthesis/export protein
VIYVSFESLTNKEFDFFNRGANQQQGLNVAAVGGGGQLFGQLVDENGEIPLPVIGKVKVAGMTVFQIGDTLQRIAARYIEEPIVKVRLMNYRITVLGEVASEGTVTLSNNRVSMIEAIGQAGGLGELADRSNIKLIRQKGGRTEVVYLNLLHEDFFHSPYYYVYQNDVLIVPPLKQRPFRRYFGQNLSLIVSTISLLLLAFNLTR